MSSEAFATTIELLLSGAVVCQYSYPDANALLQEDSESKSDIDTYLRRIGRKLAQTGDQAAYFCAYLDLDGPGRKKGARAELAEAMNELEPVILWLRLVMSAEQTDRPIHAGDDVSGARILKKLNASNVLCDELEKLSRQPLFKTTNKQPKGQLESIMEKLEKMGYLSARGRTGTEYIATGRWSRLYDLVDFIADHEGIDEEDQATQEDLL